MIGENGGSHVAGSQGISNFVYDEEFWFVWCSLTRSFSLNASLVLAGDVCCQIHGADRGVKVAFRLGMEAWLQILY